MNDPWNPSWEEILAWANSFDPDPCQDWELACVWKEGYFADYVRLAASKECPRRRFFLHLLYLATGDRVRRGHPRWQVESLIAKGDGIRHPDIRRWQERSLALLAAPETFEYFDWGGGGWSGYRTSLARDDVTAPWIALAGSNSLEAELERELAPEHPLHGARASATARRDDNDDVLFAFASGPVRFAVVHLTWSGKMELDAHWPAFEPFESLSDWRRHRMKPDHEAWSTS
jgi:hypothetical protein